ncbi:MAG: phage major tail tube protein [Paenibacillus macerans]|nr:phage major tail tube protein [Paenibacillus macerans]
MTQIEEKLNHFNAYRNGTEWLGVVDIELPSLESMSETVSGAGIGGEIDSPNLGHFGSMTVTLNWRALAKSNFVLARQESHQLDFRGSIQTWDKSTSAYKQVQVKVSVRAIPKTTGLGTFTVGGTMDNTNEMEVTYIKIDYDNATVLEIDKFNMICVIDGVDFLAQVRANLGM